MSWTCRIVTLLLFVTISLTPSDSAYSEECDVPDSPTRVYIFRGVGGYWPQIEEFADCVESRGYQPSIYFSAQHPWVKSQLARRRKSGAERGPVLIVGYSLGAEAAVAMARGLADEGIRVDQLLLIEPYANPTIPGNVRTCFNIYEPRRFDRFNPFRGTPVTPDSSHTQLIQLDISQNEELNSEFGELNHFEITTSPKLQNLVADQLP